ncbi:DUF7344 domain-containing protein [Haloarcula litorea]|uniref:DUF7344 domain-containing protein n=1 Tax=Haloarcula litorea TaxID=3032579 RepID=UPI0023E7963E|nr:hypothetical protein [Halomicroarcula sp. GDY20]
MSEGGPPDDGDELDGARVALVADECRRRLLRHLASGDRREHTLASLTAALSERADASGSTEGRDRDLRVALHHVHLPKLDDAGVIHYDPDTHRIEYLGDPEIESLLSRLDSE